MNNSEQLLHLYSRLSRRDIEEFYAGYQLWLAEQRLAVLQAEIQALRQQIEQNAERLRQLQPPEGVLNLLTTLRAWGVSDVVLLDRLCERGEEWLQAMFRRLETCQRLGLFDGDYTRWCEHALEGAYDWLDSIEEGTLLAAETATQAGTGSRTLAESEEGDLDNGLSEDEFLRRLLSEEATAGSLPAIVPAEVVVVDGAEAPVVEPSTSEQATPAEVVPLSEEEIFLATEAGLAGGAATAEGPGGQEEAAPEVETRESTVESEMSETSLSEAPLEQLPSSLAEPAMREYVGSAVDGATTASDENHDLTNEEGAEKRERPSVEQETDHALAGAFYEFSAAGSPEGASVREEVIWPEGEDRSAGEAADRSDPADEVAVEPGCESNGEEPELSEVAAEVEVEGSAAAADETRAAALADLEEPEPPQAEEQMQARPETVKKDEGEDDPNETVGIEEGEEDTAAELRFWQRIFGRHSVELD
ncbi:hypothetical protein [Thermogemmatispora onikobensis]|uniref:hypothetical protein n=1 Tax=Thermogemmatispora onikobensis TaxID=732234 RepID=UPI00085383DC|nr:hypothetical protein [Thermogemmatispora onikobensis]